MLAEILDGSDPLCAAGGLRQKQPPLRDLQRIARPPAVHSVEVTRVARGRAFDSDERSQRQRRTSAGLEKN